ncbi:hypothetical protein KNHN1_17120 [Pseudomonas guariconensis]
MIDAVASATPSINPTATTDVPSTDTMYSGSKAWIISDEMSMNIETKPNAQTLRGMEGSARLGGDESKSSAPRIADLGIRAASEWTRPYSL